MGRPKRKLKRGSLPPHLIENAPNTWAAQHGEFGAVVTAQQSAARHGLAVAYRRVPPIETLAKTNDGTGKPKLSPRQYAALAHYRDRYIACERSPIKDSCDQDIRGGGGDGFPFHRTAASIDLQYLEAKLGQCHPRLVEIARYVAGQDYSLTQWAVARHGPRDGTINEAKTSAMKYALLDIRRAGDCLADEA